MLFQQAILDLGLNIRKWVMKQRLADMDLTNRWSTLLRSISVPYIRAFWASDALCFLHHILFFHRFLNGHLFASYSPIIMITYLMVVWCSSNTLVIHSQYTYM